MSETVSLGLLWRTARHLTVEQGLHVVLRRLRHLSRQRWPAAARRRLAAAAGALPYPDPSQGRLATIASRVRSLQDVIHAEDGDVARGRFQFLGRSVDFGSLETIDWRRSLGEDSSPLWRLTLAYFGWAVPWAVRDGSSALRGVAAALSSLERAGAWSLTGIFRDLWNPYTASHRLINLLAIVSIYRAGGGQPGPAERIVLDHVRFCAAYIASDLERDLQLNHLLKNYVALAVFAAAIDEIPPAWSFLERAVPASIRQNVLRDGGHIERSPMYHSLALLDLHVLRDSGLFETVWQPELDQAIGKMTEALAYLTHPDGDIALFNDAWLTGSLPARRFGGWRPAPGRHELPVTGYVRLDGDGDCVIFDCGAIGPDFNPAHGHADYLSFEASLAGQRLIVDFGTPTYATGTLRSISRSAAVHNGPRLEGAEPVEFWKSFRVGRRARAWPLYDTRLGAAPLWAAGWQDGYTRLGTEVRRWVGLWPGHGLLVVDAWLGGELDRAVSDFLVSEPWRLSATGLSFDGPLALEVVPLTGSLGKVAPAFHWTRYGERCAATQLTLRPGPDGIAALGLARKGSLHLFNPAVATVRHALKVAPASTGSRDWTMHSP